MGHTKLNIQDTIKPVAEKSYGMSSEVILFP